MLQKRPVRARVALGSSEAWHVRKKSVHRDRVGWADGPGINYRMRLERRPAERRGGRCAGGRRRGSLSGRCERRGRIRHMHADYKYQELRRIVCSLRRAEQRRIDV